MEITVLEQIQQFVDELVAKFKPRKVVLFGSHAYGQPNEHSDVDILVIRDECSHPVKESVRMRMALPPTRFPLDLIVRSSDVVEHRLNRGDTFLSEILTRGRVMHEA